MKFRDIIYLLAIMLILQLVVSGIMEPLKEESNQQGLPDKTTVNPDKLSDISIPASSEPRINARAACVIDFETGMILYEKNAFQKRPMASTTKIMTAIIALESCSLEDEVLISGKAAWMDGSTMGLKEGETVKMADLLHGLLLCSGNDAAVAIAEFCAGSTEAFAEIMTQKAREIGAYETSFANPHGLDAENHYTTAYDLAKITRYALKNPVFNEIVKKQEYVYKGRTFRNTNEMLTGYEGADGVKTGYTGLAGRCLVTSATRNGMRFISVVLFCDTKNLRSQSSRLILDYSFLHYDRIALLERGTIVGSIPVERGRNAASINAAVADDLSTIIHVDEKDMLFTRVSMPEKLMAPVKQGTILGSVSVFKEDEIIAETSVIAREGVEKKTLADYMSQVIRSWIRVFQ